MKVIKSFLLAFISLILLGLIVRACSSPPSISTKSSTNTEADPLTVSSEFSASKTWQYSDRTDEMTSKRTYYAKVEAKEHLQFKSPYDGGSTATLVIRNKDGENNAYLSVTKGQMLTRSYESTSYRVRFDDKPLEYYPFIGPSDGSSTLVFINSTSKFLKNLRLANKVIIELEFYREGLNPIEFNVSNLKWHH